MKDAEFKIMLERSREVEVMVMKWYRENVDPKTHLAIPRIKEYDLVCPKVQNVEIKEDRLATSTGAYALEIEDASGKPSGIKATTAGEFVLVDNEFVIFTKTLSLAFMIKECSDKRLIKMGYTTKDGKRAWGYLIPRDFVLESPYINKVKRWF